ncbi:MAG: hypothetical protein AAGE80_09735 [Pseudomonadota bacterium]
MRFERMIGTGLIAAIAALPSFAYAANELDLGNGTALKVRDSGFVQVLYNDEGFGLTIEDRLKTADGGDREVTKADLERACRIVLSNPAARIGAHPPDYIFFQQLQREYDTGLLTLRRTKSTYFETRTDRCRPLSEPPREVK